MDAIEHAIHVLGFQAEEMAKMLEVADESRAPAGLMRVAAAALHEAAEVHRETECSDYSVEGQEAMLAEVEKAVGAGVGAKVVVNRAPYGPNAAK